MRRVLAWSGRQFVPLLLVPLSGALLWVALWRIWLPPLDGASVVQTVTTVDAGDASRRVTTVVKTSRAAAPSRRSEPLALVLVLLGAGAAVIAVFHDRIGSIDLGKDGLKIELTPAERDGAATLTARLASRGAKAQSYARAFERYLRVVSERRPGSADTGEPAGAKQAAAPGLSAREASALADRIADDVA